MHLGVVLEQCLAPVPGGTGRYSREIAAALARRAGPEDRVSGWVARHGDTTAAEVEGVDGPHALALPRRALVAAWERGLPPAVPADVVLAPTPLWPARQRGAVAVVVHDAVPFTHPETLTPRGARWHRAQIEAAGRHAGIVVVPTQAVASELAQHVTLPHLLVVGEGVSAALAAPSREQRTDLPERFLLSVATLEPRKGLDVLLAALAEPAAPDLPLLLVGQSGWGGTDPARLARDAGLPEDRVRVLGRVPDAELAVLLARATAVVVPSRAEGFGLPLLEAMAAGTPAVISEAPALLEVAGGAALPSPLAAAPLADALRRVTGDAELRGRLTAAGLERATHYTWDGAADALWWAFRDIRKGFRA